MPHAKRTASASAGVSQDITDMISGSTKRTRGSFSRSDTSSSTPVFKRRSNPDSLATRLGPEAVKELEALLRPGMTEMPSFAIRQAIQKKYNVNRRLIYDWFHSKGLRVTKDENRVAPGEHQACMTTQRRIIQRPIPRSASAQSVFFRNTSTDGYSDAATVSSPDLLQTPAMGYRGHCDNEVLVQAKQPYYPSYYFINPLYASHPQPNIPSSVSIPVSTAQLFSTRCSSGVSNDSEDENCQPSSPRRGTGQMSKGTTSQTADASPMSPCKAANNVGTLESLVDAQSLSLQEREAYYTRLSHALGPAQGIQESVGTYRSFMASQNERYYERLVSPSPDLSSASPDQVTASAPWRPLVNRSYLASTAETSAHRLLSMASPLQTSDADRNSENEFSNWLLYGGRSYPSSSVPSPARTPDLLSDASSEIANFWSIAGVHDCSVSNTSLDISDILESPVLRSRNTTTVADSSPGSLQNSFRTAVFHHPVPVPIDSPDLAAVDLSPPFSVSPVLFGHPWSHDERLHWIANAGPSALPFRQDNARSVAFLMRQTKTSEDTAAKSKDSDHARTLA